LPGPNPEPNLTPDQARNFSRFQKKLPKGAKPAEVHLRPGGGMKFAAEVPGKVPGSKAVYEKIVDAQGQTIRYTKTTFDPQGNVVHVKTKFSR
jgi:hypothetical protein